MRNRHHHKNKHLNRSKLPNRNRHHIKNKICGGNSKKENILILKIEKHRLLHQIFGNLDFYEIIMLLIRTSKMKHYEKINPKMEGLYKHLK